MGHGLGGYYLQLALALTISWFVSQQSNGQFAVSKAHEVVLANVKPSAVRHCPPFQPIFSTTTAPKRDLSQLSINVSCLHSYKTIPNVVPGCRLQSLGTCDQSEKPCPCCHEKSSGVSDISCVSPDQYEAGN